MHGAMISVCLFVRVQLMTCKFHQKAKRKHHVKKHPKKPGSGWWIRSARCALGKPPDVNVFRIHFSSREVCI